MRSRPSPLAALVGGAVLLAGCGGLREGRPRAVVIGIDGADWRVIEPLVASGRMPNLAALRERGVSGPIRTLVDFPLSPVIWTSVATGKTPAKHGITWFLVDQPDGTRVPVRSHNRKARALWNILAEHGRRPVVVGWWASYPAEDVGPGVIVSDALGFHGFGRSASFVDIEDNDATAGNPIALGPDSIKGPNTPGWTLAGVVPSISLLGALGLAWFLLAHGIRQLRRRA